MTQFISITEAKPRLSAIVATSDDEDVLLMRHGRPAAVIISARRWDEMHEQLEDLRDRLSVHERENLPIDFRKVMVELGINVIGPVVLHETVDGSDKHAGVAEPPR